MAPRYRFEIGIAYLESVYIEENPHESEALVIVGILVRMPSRTRISTRAIERHTVIETDFLAEDAAGGRWRLEDFDALGDSGLSGVDLVDFDLEGRTRRHLFADHLRVERRESGVVLVLTDGIQMRGGRKTPFLAGRFRIFLPQAKHSSWEEVGLLAAQSVVRPKEEAGAGTPDSDGR